MATRSALHTRICDLLGVRYPIVQTGMGWVSGAQLTAATSAAGGFGILAAATMTHDELDAAIRAVRERTDRPFGVNMRADQPDVERTAAWPPLVGERLPVGWAPYSAARLRRR